MTSGNGLRKPLEPLAEAVDALALRVGQQVSVDGKRGRWAAVPKDRCRGRHVNA
ncbi:MAG: hypothetical protein KGM44_11225 [bacterium]|nr:hypothetical protein [bacterium]